SDIKVAVMPSGVAVFGFRRPGTGDILDIDAVVDGATGPPGLHVEAEKGSARIAGDQLDVWSAAYAPGDTGCCPLSFTHQVIVRQPSGWRRVSSRPGEPAGVPPSPL